MKAATTEQPMVALGDILGRIGGTEDRVRQLVSEVGGEITKMWNGDESVTATIAARVVALHDKQHAESEAFATGYQRYCEGHAREKYAIRQAAYEAACKEQLAEQRAEFEKNQFMSGTWHLSLDPRRNAIASRAAEAAVERFERENPLLPDQAWGKKNERVWKTT